MPQSICQTNLDKEVLIKTIDNKVYGVLFSNLNFSQPNDESVPGDLLNDVLDIINGKPNTSIPLLYRSDATEFQKEVWDAIREIPYGETASYMDIATKIGRPKSFRAVANACGKNTIAILVPCHRVIASNGSLGGYRWGVDLKEKILRREKI